MRPIDVAACLLWTCLSVPAYASDAAKLDERPSTSGSRDVKVPRSLVHKLEADYRAFLKANEVPGKEHINRKLMNMSVELTQKRNAALHEDTRIVTPLGGGIVDLNEVVTPLRGSFNLKIMAQTEDGKAPENLKMYFISHAKRRKIDGSDYGTGCGKYMDVTGYLKRKPAGLELYTAGQRYLSVVGGTFVAVAFAKEGLNVGTITFRDSRYPELLCE